MRKNQPLIKSILTAIGLAFALYFIIYGVRAAGLFAGIPFLQDWLNSLSNQQIMLICGFIGVFYFAFNSLNKVFVSLLAAIFLFLFFFHNGSGMEGIWNTLQTLWHNFLNLFAA